MSSISEINNKGTVKVIQLSVPESDTDLADSIYDELLQSTSSNSEIGTPHILDDSSSFVSATSSDSGSLQSERTLWPQSFPIPLFAYDTELKLRKGDTEYEKNGKLLSSAGFKSDILEKLAEKMFLYKAYPNDAQFARVAEALVRKHPCLKEPGSTTGWIGWKCSLKFKMGNYRTKEPMIAEFKARWPALFSETQVTM